MTTCEMVCGDVIFVNFVHRMAEYLIELYNSVYLFWSHITRDEWWRQSWQETDAHWCPKEVELVDDKAIQCQQINDYVKETFEWLTQIISNEDIFPPINKPFPPYIGEVFQQVFSKLFSINVLLVANKCFHGDWQEIYSLTKKFLYFGLMWDFITPVEVHSYGNATVLAALNSYRRDKIRYQTGMP